MLCPRCHRAFDDPSLRFCTDDGAVLYEPKASLIPAKSTKELGAIVDGRYAIEGLLGQGGMARVYLAKDVASGERVALKILGSEHRANRETRERFLREVEVAAEIGHPNIIKVLDAGERQDGSPFLVLELLTGESLGELLRRERVIDPRLSLPWIRQIASAVAAAHAAGVIHRDIKPDNVFLVGEPPGPRLVKVMDFGLAKLREAPKTIAGLTLGTVPYMAPEQAVADALDGRTDVYALGVLMYRMLVGRLPFAMQDDAILVAHHLFVDPPRPTAIHPGLDPRIEGVILTAMRKRPVNRHPSMNDLLEDIERLLGLRPGDPLVVPLAVEPDVYEPQNRISQTAARHLARMIGRGA
ncbi:MAG: serine/threonine-protein kinase [Byssovorax sp.]